MRSSLNGTALIRYRGWGPWRQVWICFHSGPCEWCESGYWTNVWKINTAHFIYERWPNLWRWWVNR